MNLPSQKPPNELPLSCGRLARDIRSFFPLFDDGAGRPQGARSSSARQLQRRVRPHLGAASVEGWGP